MSRIHPGLCSVTLRASAIDDVARLAGECGLGGIEWGGDVHVAPGDRSAAARARSATAAADAVVASYGSYLFAAGLPDADEAAAVVDTAAALGAPNVRVWAGPDTPLDDAWVNALARFCAIAAAADLTVGLEYHGGTPTATVAGTLDLLAAVGAPNLFTYWQPPYWRAPTHPASDADEVTALGARLAHLHVYEWADASDRRPLRDGAARWEAVLGRAAAVEGAWSSVRYAFCEFVRDDDPQQLRRDAAVLIGWLDKFSG